LNSEKWVVSIYDVGAVGDYKCLMMKVQRTFEGPF